LFKITRASLLFKTIHLTHVQFECEIPGLE